MQKTLLLERLLLELEGLPVVLDVVEVVVVVVQFQRILGLLDVELPVELLVVQHEVDVDVQHVVAVVVA